MPLKPQLQFNLHIDNSQLTVAPLTTQINQIYSYCQQFNDYQRSFISLCHKVAPSSALATLKLVQDAAEFKEIVKEIKKEGYAVFDTVSDQEYSYKGFMTMVMVAFNNRGYIIDALVLHEEVKSLGEIWEDPNIVKFCPRFIHTMEDVKRDWQAFGMNFFDIELLEKSIGVKKGQSKWLSKSCQRPILPHIIQSFQQRYDNVIKIIAQLRYFLQQQQGQQYTIYAYSNHYEILLKEYRHRVATFAEEEKQYQMVQNQYNKNKSQNKENSYMKNCKDQWEDREDFRVTNSRDKIMCELLMNWRQHVARIVDEPSWKVISFPQLVNIAVVRPSSIMEVQQILGYTSNSLDLASKILELLALEQELNENSINDLQMRAVRKSAKEDKNIRSLLQQLKWQGKQEWLNRKNDQSIKLYKQIVSIVELDNSVVEEFTELANEGAVGRQMGRFVKYAECFRSTNHRKLKELYDQAILLQDGTDKDEDFGWESQEDEACFITGHSISGSQTSIQEIEEKSKDHISSSTLATLHATSIHQLLSQIDLNTFKIDPLPESIEDIYLKAATVKKGYQKVQKKKANRKENKQDEEFVPSWEEINLLLSM